MNKDTPCIVAQRLRDQRKALGKTQKDIADKSGLSTKTINNLEHMTAPTLSVDTFIRLCDALECSADYLLGKDALPTHELSDIHALTNLTEDAIDSLMYRKVEAYKYGYSLTSENQLLIADLISYLITHIDEHLLQQYVESSAYYDIGKSMIADMREHGFLTDTDNYATSDTIRNTVMHESLARTAKIDLVDKIKLSIEEWMQSRLAWDVTRILEEINMTEGKGSYRTKEEILRDGMK